MQTLIVCPEGKTSLVRTAPFALVRMLLPFGLALAPSAIPGPAMAETLAAWVELVGPGSEASVRVITNDASCPTLRADGAPLPMQVRAEPGQLFSHAARSARFPVRVCQVMAPPGKARVLLEGKALPVPRAEIRRIVVFGDTGCRVKKDKIQVCVPKT